MNMTAILDLKIFTKVTFKMSLYPFYLKLYAQIHIFNVGHFGLLIAAFMGKTRVGPDHFEISVSKLPCILIFMLLSLIWTIRLFLAFNIRSIETSCVFFCIKIS